MLRSALAFFLIAAALPAQEPAQVDIKRVVLYKNGVGYFELDGSVTGNREVSLSFPSGQLNDVLKTITVLDLNGGRIAGIGYASQPPVGRQLGELPLPQGNDAALRDFLDTVSHDLKTPLSTIATSLYLIERLDNPETRSEHLHRIKLQTKLVEKSIQDNHTDISIVPLAAPLIAGPGTITAAIAFASNYGETITMLSLTLAVFVNFLFMLGSRGIGRVLERLSATGPLIRITGLVVAAVAVQMVLGGLGEWLVTVK